MSNPSLLCVPYRFKTSKLYSQIPDSGLGDFTVTRATTPTAGQATRVNAQGFIELVADNVPRLDYPVGGITAGCPALLVEPAATNSIRNNSMVGAVAGSPGTLPTNWSNSGSGLTRQSVATGTLNGIPYVDIRISGTATNTFHDVFWDTSTAIAALVGQNWAASCYLQIVAQPNPPGAYALAMREFNSGGTFLGVFIGSTLSISTTSFNRFSFTRALTQATVAFVQPSLFFSLVNGQTYDFTVRIGYPQMELGSVATSVIPTTTTAITRGADVVSQTGVSSLIGQTEGTFYLDFSTIVGTNSNVIFVLGDSGVGQNRLRILGNASRELRFIFQLNGNVIQYDFARTGAVTSLTDFKIAVAYKSGDIAVAVNGSVINTSTNSLTFSGPLNSVELSAATVGFLTQRYRAVELYPTRLPNTGTLSLQSLTQ